MQERIMNIKLPLERGRWRGAPDEVLYQNERKFTPHQSDTGLWVFSLGLAI